jgi:cytidylate kinase
MNAGPSIHKYNYRNLTISGLPGSGSTTLLSMLKDELKLDGWRGFSGGEFMRAYAEEKGLFNADQSVHHDASHYEDDFDRQVDMGMREKLQSEEMWILESWLSGFMAQQVPGVLKVLMICSENAVRVDRIVNRDDISVDAAKKHLHERYENNYTKWKRMYADQWQQWVVAAGTRSAEDPIDFWHPDLYDVVIDTYSHNKEETLQMVLDAIEKKA